MGKSYKEKLKDPRWQKKRLKVLERDEWMCQCCTSTEKTLHVHHKVYKKGNDPWDYKLYELLTLCSDCHEREHQSRGAAIEEVVYLLKVHGFFALDIDILAEVIDHAVGGRRFGGAADFAFFLERLVAVYDDEVSRYIDEKFKEYAKKEQHADEKLKN